MFLTDRVSYVSIKTLCICVLGKQNTVEMPRELRGWLAGRKRASGKLYNN